MTIKIYLSSVAIVAPGLEGWKESQAVLLEKEAYIKKDLTKIAPAILPANERRRTTPLIKLAMHVAEQCIGEDLSRAQDYATVFSSSDGDHSIHDKMCRALNLPDRPVSPTNFHNSVHNAPAGYWAIAAKAQYNSNSLSACDESFSAGLIEVATYTSIEQKPVLYVAYDVPAPKPLDTARHLEAAFGVAMCLSATKEENSIAELELNLDFSKDTEHTVCKDALLDTLRLGNPAARSLPLLQAIANKTNVHSSANAKSSVVIPHVQSTALKINIKHLK